jgi:capsular exopolysaccharide synthesis family protein
MQDTNEVKLHFLDYWRVLKVRSGIILLAFLLVLITAGITVYFLPREYLSKVTIQVQDNQGLQIFGQEGRGATDLRFAPTQFQIIQRKEILYPVLDNLQLTEKWAGGGRSLTKEQAYFKLLRKLDMSEIRNTDLIEIGVYSTIPQEAADVANSIAIVYQDKRRSDQMEVVSRGLRQLEEEVLKQRQKVADSAGTAAKIRTEQGIIDLNPDTLETVETSDTRSILLDESKVAEADLEVTKLQTQLQQVDQLRPEELMVALNTLNIQDQTVAQTLPLYQQAMAEEARLLGSGLGKNHPKIRSLTAQKEVFTTQLQDAIGALRGTLATRLKIAQATYESVKKQLDESKKGLLQAKSTSAEYIESKSDYIQAKKVLEAAEMKLHTERMQTQISFSPAKIWEKAEAASYPSKPNVVWYMVLAVLVGLVIGVGLAFFIEYLDTSVKSLEDVEKFLEIPVLAVIPKGISLLYQQKTDGPDAEAYRILRTNIEFNRRGPDDNTITAISGGPGEGKSTTINNLAVTCARGGYNVLLVDADLRRPSQHRILEVPNRVGLADYLTGKSAWEDLVSTTSVENLSFLSSGLISDDSVGILNSQRMVDLIKILKGRFDLVFFDSPPILGVSDGSVLASEVDMTMMVVQHRRFPRSMLQRVKQAVHKVGGNLLGTVLNNVDTRQDTGYQYYSNYTDYYYSPQKEAGPKKRAKPNEKPQPARAGLGDADQY